MLPLKGKEEHAEDLSSSLRVCPCEFTMWKFHQADVY